jgi:hypothetical protein
MERFDNSLQRERLLGRRPTEQSPAVDDVSSAPKVCKPISLRRQSPKYAVVGTPLAIGNCYLQCQENLASQACLSARIEPQDRGERCASSYPACSSSDAVQHPDVRGYNGGPFGRGHARPQYNEDSRFDSRYQVSHPCRCTFIIFGPHCLDPFSLAEAVRLFQLTEETM